MFRSNRLPLLVACATATLLALFPMSSLQAQAEPTDKLVLVPQHLLGLIHAPEVHRELRFTPEQVTKLESFFTKMDGLWFRARNLPTEEQYEAISKIETALRSWMKKNASAEQLARLQQLELQAQGIRMLLRPELAEKIGMDAGQTAKLTRLAEDTAKATLALQRATMANAVTDKMTAAVAAAATAENDAIKTVMRAEQLRMLGTLIGEKFDTAALKRIYPMAPELVPAKHWINSNPLTMKELRGKVVLLHFYAFQCHNCHANFGHYTKWHDKYDDSEVVVIGIQTPETSRERDPDAVIAAAKERSLEFPILIDLESENWKAWSNTMWPTVYVIDKKGYIRQWWQGELNWNGATGDATIEKVVDELLQEPA